MIRRTPIRKVRSKPRPGRLKGKAMTELRRFVFERDNYRCQHIISVEGMLGAFHCLTSVTWETGELAHKQAKRRGGDSPENTYCCCKEHHRLYHAYGPSMTKPCPPKPK